MGRKFMESNKSNKTPNASSSSSPPPPPIPTSSKMPLPNTSSSNSNSSGGIFDSIKQGLGFGVGVEASRHLVNGVLGPIASTPPSFSSSLNASNKDNEDELKEDCIPEKREAYTCIMEEDVYSCNELINDYKICVKRLVDKPDKNAFINP